MARPRKLLAGAAKDAYLKRVLAAEPGLDEATRERIAQTLQAAIALIATRQGPQSEPRSPVDAAPASEIPCEAVSRNEAACAPVGTPQPEPFDPYSPNVIVVFRTRGRDAALAELHTIDDVDCLRLLAREQQLGIAPDLADPSAIRQAIVAAAERRVANRRAAAS